MKKTYTRGRLLGCQLGLAVFSSSTPLLAQSSPGPSPTDAAAPAREETIQLSPFAVRADQDQGYESQETLSGTRLRTPTKFVGSAISEVNPQLMQDLAMFSVKDVIDYTTNAVAYDDGRMGGISDANQNAAITTSASYNIRGGRTSSTSMDFISTRVATDGYNIERISVARGPNAILFGLGGPEGMVNVVPTRAEMKDSYEFATRFDNWGSYRGSLKLNQQFIKNRLAFFLAGLEENKRSNRKPSDKKHERITGAVTFRPFRSTTLRASVERAHLHDLAVRPWPVQDGLSAWIAAGSNELPPELQNGGAMFASITPTPAQVAQRPALAARLMGLGFQLPFRGAFTVPMKVLNSTGGEELPWLNTLGMPVTRYNQGVGVARVPNSTLVESPVPYKANVPGYGQALNINFTARNFMLEQAIGRHLTLQGVLNIQNARFLTNNTTNVALSWLMRDKNPTLLTIDNRIIRNPNYDRYFTIAGNPSVTLHNYFDEAKVFQAVYKDDFRERLPGRLGRILGHFNVSGLIQQNKAIDRFSNEFLSNATPSALFGVTPQFPVAALTNVAAGQNSALQVLTYIDPADSSTWGIPDLYSNIGSNHRSVFAGSPLPSRDPSGVTPYWRVNNSTKAMQTIRSKVVVLQNYFWEDRIVPTFGWRQDVAENRNIFNATAPYNGMTGWLLDASDVDIYKGDAAHPVTYNKQVGHTETAGVVVYPIPQVGLFFNQSSNYESVGSSANRNQFGEPLPPSKSVGKDYGIKLPLLGGKLFVTLNRYTVVQENVTNSNLKNGFGGSINPSAALFAISRQLSNQTGDVKFKNFPWISDSTVQWAGTNDGEQHGYELSLTANPTRNWRIMLNAAKQYSASANFGQVEQRWHDTQLAYVEANYPHLLDLNTGDVGARGVVETLREDFADYQTAISQSLSLAGIRDSRQPEWTGNLVMAYDLKTGPMKNFGVGGSFRYRSKTTIGYAFQRGSTRLYDAKRPFYGPSRNPLGFFVNYRFRLGRDIRGLAQLNADAVNMDSKLYPYLATDDGTGNPLVARYAVGEGTTWALSVKFNY